MKLSTKSRYGLKAIFVLSKEYGNVTSLTEIAKNTNISTNYLEKLLTLLKKGKLVETKRGVDGGYFLPKHPREITVGEVLRVLEDNLQIIDCNGEAPCFSQCPTKNIWDKVYKAINTTLDEITLQDMIDQN